MIKTGMRVKFLNDAGGGLVTKMVSKETAMVLGADGFEIPYMINELLIDASEDDYSATSNTSSSANSNESKKEVIAEEPYYTASTDTNVYVAFIPEDQKFLVDFNYEIFLVNDSNYFLHYSFITRQQDGTYTTQMGEIEPNISEPLAILTRDKITDDMEMYLQAIFFDKKEFKIKAPVNKNLNVRPVKFYKAGSFTDNDFFDEKAMLVSVCEEDKMEKAAMKISAKDIENAMRQNSDNKKLNTPKQARKRIVNNQKEIDLHIHELIDDETGMNNADRIKLQLDTFKKELDSAIKAKLNKIIFIHGVGNGVLKHELRRELQRTYKRLKFQDASFQEYGYGATMVLLR